MNDTTTSPSPAQVKHVRLLLTGSIALGLLLVVAGSVQLTRFILGGNMAWLLDAYHAVLWGVLPAFISVLVALRRQACLTSREQLWALAPTFGLLLLAAAIYINRWI